MGALNIHSSCKCEGTSISYHRRVKVWFLAFVEEISEMISVYCKKIILIKHSESDILVRKWLGLERQGGIIYSGHTFSIG